MFWSSVVLTGNPTFINHIASASVFWSSVVLTGNPTMLWQNGEPFLFWSSVVLTGNPTHVTLPTRDARFGAVSF